MAQCSAEQQSALPRLPLKSRNYSAQAQYAKCASTAPARKLQLFNASQATPKKGARARPGVGHATRYATRYVTRYSAERGLIFSAPPCYLFQLLCSIVSSQVDSSQVCGRQACSAKSALQVRWEITQSLGMQRGHATSQAVLLT